MASSPVTVELDDILAEQELDEILATSLEDPQPDESFPFLRLSQELQDMVIAAACVKLVQPVDVRRSYCLRRGGDDVPWNVTWYTPQIPRLARVSRQFRDDTLSIYWGKNTFYFDSLPGFKEWANTLRDNRIDVRSLSHIIIYGPHYSYFPYLKAPSYRIGIDIRVVGSGRPLRIDALRKLVKLVSEDSLASVCTCALQVHPALQPNDNPPADTMGNRILDAVSKMQPIIEALLNCQQSVRELTCSDCGKLKCSHGSEIEGEGQWSMAT